MYTLLLISVLFILNFLNLNSILFFNLKNDSLILHEYLPIFIFIILATIISLVIVTLSYLLARQNPDIEKLSTYECGFEPYEDARTQFDVKFYLIAILFIVFDVEIMFMLPWSIVISKINVLGFWSMIDFTIELGIGLIYVWYLGVLDCD